MKRRELDFESNPDWLQEWILKNTWCDQCDEADLGLIAPKQFELGGRVFVEGRCPKCNTRVVSEVREA